MRRRSYQEAKKRRKAAKVAGIIVLLLFMAAGLYLFIGMQSQKDTYRLAGIEAYEAGNLEEALNCFSLALEEEQFFSDALDEDILFYQGAAYLQLGEFDLAAATYERLGEMEAEHKDTAAFYGQLSAALVEYEKGESTDCIPIFQEAINKGYDTFYLYLGSCYARQQDYGSMETAFDSYLDCYPKNGYIYAEYAAKAIAETDYEEAYANIQSGMALQDGAMQELEWEEIVYYEYMHDYQTAYDKLKPYIEKYPDDETAKREYDFLYTRVEEK